MEVPSIDFLLEFCTGATLVIANTFTEQPLEEKVTFREAGTLPFDQISEASNNILDLVLCQPVALNSFERVANHREAALATDHYLVTCSVGFETPAARHQQTNVFDKAAIRDNTVRESFTNIFNAHGTVAGNAQQTWENMKNAIAQAQMALPRWEAKTQRSWITRRTLDLIAQRSTARSNNNREE